ncbi:hypothetical protein P691DRAFT_381997 [Macrolepiota fuliginosa MF-IS2]|uniref:Uncharacterized protein n=1 Tax=Macrolepiota fuliginosa MF-IS2 TaxID=1400762 RepID=A0A9P5XH40_9AGAR|nr:hypothetical protein P691DRAFT_381997 [Macrolepiota fuliginosa MF-IS2]
MDTPQPLPRLRVSRASPSRLDRNNTSIASSSQAGPSRLTDFTQLVDLNLSDIRASHDYTDEDDAEDQYPTPRMSSTAPLAPASTTPGANLAGRLRELIHLVPNGSGSQSTPTPRRPPSPTFHESDFEGESTAGYSRARESLRDIFTQALREPGDTPQKGRPRRNSDGTASEMDPSPQGSKEWSGIKGKRKSLSDEESDNPTKPYLNGSSQRTVFRSSRDSNAVEFPLKSISAEDSDDAEDSPKPQRASPPNATGTLQSLRLSQNLSFPQHSNLLDQDSEMQRAFGELESFDDPSAHLQKPRVYLVISGARSFS